MSLDIPAKQLPSAQRRRRWGAYLLTGLFFTLLAIQLDFNFLLLLTDGHHFVNLLREMFPPNIALLWESKGVYRSLLETVAMAFLGTVTGGSIAFCFALLAARNTSPHPLVRLLFRAIITFERVIPSLILILILTIIIGLGPFAGLVAITIGTIGLFSKLFADVVEEADKLPLEGLRAIGASRTQVIKYGILPQVLPAFVSNLFYVFDVNLRRATSLGVFGGGGIGYEVHMAMKLQQYNDAIALILFTLILISVFEKISDIVRRQILKDETLR